MAKKLREFEAEVERVYNPDPDPEFEERLMKLLIKIYDKPEKQKEAG